MSSVIRLFSLLILVSACTGHSPMRITHLRCEQQKEPAGLDVLHPRFSWELESNRRGAGQSAYQIVVASGLATLNAGQGDMWDSKKCVSGQSIQIKYSGKKLSGETIYYWKVRVWDDEGKVTGWSEPARWETGLLHPDEWMADWINAGDKIPENEEDFYKDHPAPLFRRDFTVDKQVDRARLYISGLGYYEATLNGKRVGDHMLDPGWTTYSKRVLYSTYDVSDLMQTGGNCLGVMVGNGWYNPLPMKMWGVYNLRDHLTIGQPRFIARLTIRYTDGTTSTIVTGKEWKTHAGPVMRNNIYLGEVYDARREIEEWNIYGFDDSGWRHAEVASDAVGELQAQRQPPVRITGKLNPVQLTEPEPGVYIFDMGQNYAGWVKLKVKAPAGTRIKLRYGELLHDDGTLNGLTSVAGQIKGRKSDGTLISGAFGPDTAWQSDTYITSGKGTEYYTPRFTFHGFRYVEVTGYPGEPPLDAIEGFRLSSDLERSGSFECSNTLYNDIQKMTTRTFLSNVFSVQSDCPHRERFGYGGDIAATSGAFIYNFDMSGFYAKVVRDLQDAAGPGGRIRDTAPFVGIDYCGIGWALAHPLLLLELYRYYGDISLIEEQYPVARRWFEGVMAQNDLIITEGLSDHESLAPVSPPEMVTPLYYQSALMMSRLATIAGQEKDATRYEDLSERIKTAYLEAFPEKDTGSSAPFTQGSQAFALYTGLTPPQETGQALLALIRDIQAHGGHLTTGIFGTRYMLDVLSSLGHAAIAGEIVNQKDFPGWGYMLANGATTLWEHWAFSDHIYSHNHPMFGSVSEWFYKWIAGIQPAPSARGFDKIVIRPQPVPRVNRVTAHYHSVHGEISTAWEVNENRFTLHLSVPVNTTATVYIPAADLTGIKEGGTPVSQVKDVTFVKMENGHAVFTTGSGSYLFESRLK